MSTQSRLLRGGARAAVGLIVVGVAASAVVLLNSATLPAIARDLEVSIPQAGLLVTLFAFTVAAFGPFLTAYFARFERRKLFISVLIMFGLANTLAAFAPNIWVMSVARLIPALGLPVFWALASETAVDIVGPDYAGRAIAKIGFGIVCATVFGIPVGTLISDAFGWRSAFGILAVILKERLHFDELDDAISNARKAQDPK